MYFTYAEHNRTFQSLGVWIPGAASVTGLAEPEQVRVVSVSDGVLEAFAVAPALGRWLSAADQIPGAPRAGQFLRPLDHGNAQLRLLAAALRRRPLGDRPQYHGRFDRAKSSA
jgi:hypothetical protein